MAGEAEKAGKATGKWIDLADHPLIFAIALAMVIVPIMALLNWGFTELNMPGPASLFKHP